MAVATDTVAKDAIYRRVREVVMTSYEGNCAAFGRAVGISQSTINRIMRGKEAEDNHTRIMLDRLTRAVAMNHPIPTTPIPRRPRQFTPDQEPTTLPASDVTYGSAWIEATIRPVNDTTQTLARLAALKERLFEVTLEVEEIENSLRNPGETG